MLLVRAAARSLKKRKERAKRTFGTKNIDDGTDKVFLHQARAFTRMECKLNPIEPHVSDNHS